MVKVLKYSKENLLNCLNRLENKVYLFFYDLRTGTFDSVINNISVYFDEVEDKKAKVKGDEYLLFKGYLKHEKLGELVSEIDSMDIEEFSITEYLNSPEINDLLRSIGFLDKFLYRQIYVNLEKGVIQLHNFY